MNFFFFTMILCTFVKATNITESIQINKIFTYFLVPHVDALPIAIVPPSLPSGTDITAPFFRGIKLYRKYCLFDEVMR